MPGLLETPDNMFGSAKYTTALLAEFLGSMLFSTIGSASLYVATVALAPPPNVVYAALANGFMLAIAIYLTANLSGGHITPTVTVATMITGHIPILKGVLYMVVQFIGSVFGSLLIAGLIPGSSIGMGNSGPGCFSPAAGVSNGQLFGWEFVDSFILVSVVYAVAVGSPSFGNVAPLIVGISLIICLFGSAGFSGGGVSPARVFGPAAVFHCHWNKVPFYWLGEFGGCILAGLLACPLYGGHAAWLDKALPWGFHHYESKSQRSGMEGMGSAHDGDMMVKGEGPAGDLSKIPISDKV